MAYPHIQYEVRMKAGAASTATALSLATAGARVVANQEMFGLSVTYNPSSYGSAQWGPGTIPHRIVRVAAETDANLTDPQDLIFWTKLQTVSATGIAARFRLPTNTATGIMTFKDVTSNVVVYPGQKMQCGVSTAISSVNAIVYLLVEPVPDNLRDVTDAQRTTAP